MSMDTAENGQSISCDEDEESLVPKVWLFSVMCCHISRVGGRKEETQFWDQEFNPLTDYKAGFIILVGFKK